LVATISWFSLLWCLVPVAIVCTIYFLWNGKLSEVIVASTRMLIQLGCVGYVLVFLFSNPSPWISLAVMAVMMLAATWISTRLVHSRREVFVPAMIALLISVSIHLIISLKLVMNVETWYEPRALIPLAGMYFANTMNAISLATERYQSEQENGKSVKESRLIAFRTSMIPQINGLMAVGLVSLPGMMTGQILSGVSPLVAVRYQILIMAMLLGTCGLGAALILMQLGRDKIKNSSKIANQPKQ
jgi:putative ABC transport system permease protein